MHFLTIDRILYLLPAFVMAISCHEFAHAWVADRFGDPTARQYGRLTLNPMSHFDLFGFLLFIFAGFGWAKGVPYNSHYFRGNKRIAMIAVSLAGVAANLILAILGLITYAILFGKISSDSTIMRILENVFYYNIVFFIFNLIPIPPLDGSKIIAALLPGDFEEKIAALNPYGFIILIALVYLNWFDQVLWVMIRKMETILFNLIFPIFMGGF